MKPDPLISIVTASFNQGRFLGETLQSLVDQDYPNLEVIIQDGGSTDGSIEVAERYLSQFPQVFRLFVEKDHGQAHALNLGFAKTRGEIMGFLNSDDTLYPGCLRSVAREIAPECDRFVVFGRCLFTGEDSPYVGVEHPAEFDSHFEQLAIWKRGFNTIPQPSTFWHRRVWDLCGGMDESENHVLDYDLFCRFSRRFHFYKADELWASYRMHSVSKSAQRTEAEVLAMSIAASRRNWPGLWHPLRWRLAVSHWLYERHAHERARHHARKAEQAMADGHRLRAAREFAHTLALSPSMGWHRLLQPMFLARGLNWLERLVWLPNEESGGFTGQYEDGWMGRVYRERLSVPAEARSVRVELQHCPQADGRNAAITVELVLSGRVSEKVTAASGGVFEIVAGLRRYRGKTCWLELRVSPCFIPSDTEGTDHRKLGALLRSVEVS